MVEHPKFLETIVKMNSFSFRRTLQHKKGEHTIV